MKKKNIILLMFSFMLMINLFGCSSSKTSSSKETNYYKLNIDGDKVFIDEKDDNVQNTLAFMEEFIKVYADVDYKNDKYLKEIDYYTSASKKLKIEYGYVERINNQITSYEIVKKLDNFEVEKVEFYNVSGVESAEVTCKYVNTITHSVDEYLQLVNMQANVPYTIRCKILLEKENNNWLVSQIMSKETVKE